MYNELLDFVDDKDNILWTKEKHEIYSQKLINRICHVIVFNSLWEIALQKRSQTVSFMPWAWWTSAWWHVSTGENYENSAVRELEEEIWVVWSLVFVDKVLYKNKEQDHSKFLWIFKIPYEWEFSYNDGEVEYVKWCSLKEIKTMISHWEDFHPELIFILEKYFFRF